MRNFFERKNINTFTAQTTFGFCCIHSESASARARSAAGRRRTPWMPACRLIRHNFCHDDAFYRHCFLLQECKFQSPSRCLFYSFDTSSQVTKCCFNCQLRLLYIYKNQLLGLPLLHDLPFDRPPDLQRLRERTAVRSRDGEKNKHGVITIYYTH